MAGEANQAGADDPNRRYTYALYRFRLPYRLFLDDGVYFVSSGGVRWRVSLRTIPLTRIDYTLPAIDFGTRAQLRLDNHGISGFTDVISGCPLEPAHTGAELVARQSSAKRITLAGALKPVNRLIALYRAKTGEFWFRSVGVKDIPATTMLVLPEGQTEMEFYLTSTNGEIASGYPYLKTERWYQDLLARAASEETVPFALELILEGQDAFARDNLRLAATNFALSAEALFRSLLRAYFPGEEEKGQRRRKKQKTVQQMLAMYYQRYREIADPAGLPITKKEAWRLLGQVWAPRDLLAHGHELDLKGEEVAAAEQAALKLFLLWRKRPNSWDMMIEGPFLEFGSIDFPSRNPHDHVDRARQRLRGGHRADAQEAARFALVLDPHHVEASITLGVIAWESGHLAEALEHLEAAYAIDSQRPGLETELVRLRSLIAKLAEPREPAPPPNIHLINGLFMLLADNVRCARNWAFYLFSGEFDGEPELRNKIGCIWLHSLLTSLSAEEQRLPEFERRAQELGLEHLQRFCPQVRAFMSLVRDIVGAYSKIEQLFLFDNAGQLIRSFTDREAETIPVLYYESGRLARDDLTREGYQGLIRPLYESGPLDETLKTLIDRTRRQELGYWKALTVLTEVVLDDLYSALLGGREFRIPGI
jgi:hypothetical protein